MKHVGSFISQLAAYGVALMVTSLVASVQADEGKAVVQTVRGRAQYSEGGQWKALRVGQRLTAGTTIRTEANSYVDLFMKENGPVVRITPDSTLGLDKLFFEQTGGETVIDTRLNLTNGRILGNVKKMAAASKYEVKIPTGTVGIRGTDYDISANGVVTVITGQVNVMYITPTGPQNFTVGAGQTITPPATTGGAPTVAPTPPAQLQEVTTQFAPVSELVGKINPDNGELVIVERPLIEPGRAVENAPVVEPVSPTTGIPPGGH